MENTLVFQIVHTISQLPCFSYWVILQLTLDTSFSFCTIVRIWKVSLSLVHYAQFQLLFGVPALNYSTHPKPGVIYFSLVQCFLIVMKSRLKSLRTKHSFVFPLPGGFIIRNFLGVGSGWKNVCFPSWVWQVMGTEGKQGNSQNVVQLLD